MRSVAVLGGGSWGTALSVHLARLGHDIPVPQIERLVVAGREQGQVGGGEMLGIPVPDHDPGQVGGQARIAVGLVPDRGATVGHVRLVLYRRLARAVQAQDWAAGAAALAGIRRWVMVNLGLGLLTIAIVLLSA